jgi:hypothetical protein
MYSVSYTLNGRKRAKTFRLHLYPSQAAAFKAALAFRRQQETAMQRERRAALRRQWEAAPGHCQVHAKNCTSVQ